MKWALIAGGRGSRLELMRIMPGVGLGGMALRHGAVCRANAADNAEWLAACPVMLAEKLLSGVAFPVFDGSGAPAGVMLFGRRHGLPYAEADAGWIAPLIPRFIEMVGDGAL
ncbi:hypothetical protein [Paenibacillus sp. UNC496MF]|uniref:hypothetical protein n=1 Tax=Paenibacillus sp. UNC496MF TaxID=1502753 RepID=UPI00210A8B05|nr:hypothetical protein [Paenibacillus sp. UNC496MF]